MPSIATTLGVGSGLDTKAIIDALVSAQQVPRDAGLKARSDKIGAQVSGLAQLRSGLSALTSALANRTRDGALGALPVSSDPSLFAASATAGAVPALKPSDIEVRRLATGQTLVSAALATRSAPAGLGTLTLRTGTMTGDGAGGFSFSGGAGDPVDIAVTPATNTLTGLRDAINAAQAAVQASIIDDASGARLVLKGGSGGASAFILTAAPAAGDPGLDRFVHMPATSAMAVAASAADALLSVDGVEVARPGNVVADVVPDVRLTLLKAAPGTVARLGLSRDPAGLTAAVGDLVSALNALRALTVDLTKAADADTGTSSGALLGDASVRRLRQQLGQLISAPVAGGTPSRLTELGIASARDGSIGVDGAKLAAVIAAAPDAVERMLAALTADGSRGQPQGLLVQLQATIAGGTAGTGSAGRLARAAAAIGREQATGNARMTTLRSQLTRQYAAMEVSVTGLKATQSFLDQQIKAWNRTTS